jgi:hypothetical protein
VSCKSINACGHHLQFANCLVEQQQSKDMRHWSCRDCGPTTAVWRGHPVCSTCGSSYITSDLLYERKELQVVEPPQKTAQEKT